MSQTVKIAFNLLFYLSNNSGTLHRSPNLLGQHPLLKNQMFSTVFEEMNIRQVKIEALAWLYNCTLDIFNTIT